MSQPDCGVYAKPKGESRRLSPPLLSSVWVPVLLHRISKDDLYGAVSLSVAFTCFVSNHTNKYALPVV